MTHSPAPWRYCSGTGQIVDANNRMIARVWFTKNRVRDHANGELLASAPITREAYGNLSGETATLIAALDLCVKAIDQLLPGMRHIPCDVGLINQALIQARPLVEDE